MPFSLVKHKCTAQRRAATLENFDAHQLHKMIFGFFEN